jgi:hypothetical protein
VYICSFVIDPYLLYFICIIFLRFPGEALFVPEASFTAVPLHNPGSYSKAWAELALQADPYDRNQEVRAAWRTQVL